MYVIRDKKTKTILQMLQSVPGEDRKPKDVYPEFDPKAMEFGKSDGPSIPAWFTIENGIVQAVDPPADRAEPADQDAAEPVAPSLDELKASTIAYYSQLALTLRQALIPDYKLQNAALGLYDEQQAAAIRDTVKAFRDEFYRLKSAIEKVRSVKGFKDVTPNFPTEVAAPGPERNAEPVRNADSPRTVESPRTAESPRNASERPRRPNA
jgi:hypothetical protein